MSNIRVKWHVDDGYTRPGPQSFRLDVEEMAENCETEQQARDYLSDSLHEEFQQTATPCLDNEEEVIDAWRSLKSPEKSHGRS